MIDVDSVICNKNGIEKCEIYGQMCSYNCVLYSSAVNKN